MEYAECITETNQQSKPYNYGNESINRFKKRYRNNNSSDLTTCGGGSPASYQHWAETAIIGEDTRRLLIAWSKLNDAANEYSELIERLYTSQADQMLEAFMENFSKVSDEILEMIPAFIIEGQESSRGKQAEI